MGKWAYLSRKAEAAIGAAYTTDVYLDFIETAQPEKVIDLIDERERLIRAVAYHDENYLNKEMTEEIKRLREQ